MSVRLSDRMLNGSPVHLWVLFPLGCNDSVAPVSAHLHAHGWGQFCESVEDQPGTTLLELAAPWSGAVAWTGVPAVQTRGPEQGPPGAHEDGCGKVCLRPEH